MRRLAAAVILLCAGLQAAGAGHNAAGRVWQLVNLLGDSDPANDPRPTVLAELAARLARYRQCKGTADPTACP